MFANVFQLGASLEELNEAEEALKCRLPPAVRLLFRYCNGQRTPSVDTDLDGEPQSEAHYVGLIGGYNFSHHFVNVHLLSLRQVMTSSDHPWFRFIHYRSSGWK